MKDNSKQTEKKSNSNNNSSNTYQSRIQTTLYLVLTPNQIKVFFPLVCRQLYIHISHIYITHKQRISHAYGRRILAGQTYRRRFCIHDRLAGKKYLLCISIGDTSFIPGSDDMIACFALFQLKTYLVPSDIVTLALEKSFTFVWSFIL